MEESLSTTETTVPPSRIRRAIHGVLVVPCVTTNFDCCKPHDATRNSMKLLLWNNLKLNRNSVGSDGHCLAPSCYLTWCSIFAYDPHDASRDSAMLPSQLHLKFQCLERRVRWPICWLPRGTSFEVQTLSIRVRMQPGTQQSCHVDWN